MSDQGGSRFFRLFIEPRRSSPDVDVAVRARLLSFVLLSMIVLFSTFDSYRFYINPSYKIPWLGYGFLFGSYFLNKIGQYRISSFAAAAMFPIVILQGIYFGEGPVTFISATYLIVGLVFAGLLLSFRELFILSVIDLIGLLLVPYVRPDVTPPGSVTMNVSVALILATVFLLAFVFIRDHIEKLRRAEIIESLTAKKKAEENLRKQEAFQERVLYTSPLISYVFDLRERRMVFISKSLAAHLGHRQEDDLSAEFLTKFVHPDDQKLLVRDAASWKEARETDLRELEMRFLDSQGKWRTFHSSRAIFARDEQGNVSQIIGTAADITERKALEDRLRHAQKMETLGQLAGGVAHDFNNLLTPIIGYSELLLIDLKSNSPYYEELSSIAQAGQKAKALVQQLLSFSRKQVLEFRTLGLNQIVRDFQKILRRTIRENVEIRYSLEDMAGSIHADAFQIEQILMNLAINAQDAMPNGGVLTVETGSIEIDADMAATMPEVPAGSYVRLEVGDSGSGMDAETAKHIFEPFFTTKEVGKGTGLGLATVYGIVKQHGGHIGVYSELDHGTVFKIYLPRMAESLEKSTAGIDEVQKKGSGTIVVVEDNDMARELVCRVLREHGFTTIDFGDPVECLRDFRSNSHDVKLLVTDIIMPGMNGKELFHEMQKLIPTLRVAYISGYSDSIISRHGILEEGAFLIPKPFTISVLMKRVHEALA